MSYCNFSSLILSSIVMVSLYADSNRVFGKHNGLSEGRVVSLTKNEYFFAVNFLCISVKPLESISDE